MSATERYLSALEHQEPDSELEALLARVESEDGALAAIRCLEQRVQRADDGEPELRQAVVELCDRVAREASGEVALEAALRAVSYRAPDAPDARDAVLRALLLTVHSPTELKRAADATGGVEDARAIVAEALKSPEVKADADRSAELRRLLGKLYDIDGDADRAFFEMLKALRKAPGTAVYLDEAFQLALAAERFDEAVAVFVQLSDDDALDARTRATLCNKTAHLLERGLDNPREALIAYERSLELHPDSKGARRHRDRLRALLGEDAPAAEVEADDLVIASDEQRGPPGPPPLDEDSLDRTLDLAPIRDPNVTTPGVELDSLVMTAEAPRPATDLETAEAPDLTGSAPPISELFGDGAELEESQVLPQPTPGAFDEDALEPGAELRSPFDSAGLKPPDGIEPLEETGLTAVGDDSDEEASTRLVKRLAEQPAVTVEEPAQDVFERAGTLLGGDDVDGCVECAEAMLAREDRGSMALRLAGHALHLAAEQGRPLPTRAAAVFEHEAGAHPDVAWARAKEILDLLDEPSAFEPVFVAAATAAEDPARARALLEPVARIAGPPSDAMRALDAALGDDLETRLEIRQRAAREDRLQARYWVESSAELLEEAGERARARELWAELALNLATDDEKIRVRAREAHADDPEAEREFITALVATLPRARVRGLREELARALLAEGELDQAEAHGRALADDPYARGAGFSLLGAVLEARGDVEGARALAEEQLTVAYEDGQPGDDELLALCERLLTRVDIEEIEQRVKAHVARDVGELSGVAAVSALLEARGHTEPAAGLLHAAADAGGHKSTRRAWLEEGLRMSLASEAKGLANQICETLLDLDPDHLHATLTRAELALELGDARGAIKPLERLAARTDDVGERSRLHLQIGRILEDELGEHEDAKKRYRAAVEAAPDNADAWRALITRADAEDDDEARVEALAGLIRALPAHDEALADHHRAHGAALARLGRKAEAEAAWLAALHEKPDDGAALEAWLDALCRRVDEVALTPELQPSDDLLEVIEGAMDSAWQLEAAPVAARRLALIARARREETGDLAPLFEGLLAERPEDAPLLEAWQRWLSPRRDEDALRDRGDALESMLALSPPAPERARLGGELAFVRRRIGDPAAAVSALRGAIGAALQHPMAIGERALDEALKLLASGEVSDPKLRVDALEVMGRRLDGDKGAMFLEEGARVARERADDPDRARALLQLAVDRAPGRAESREALLDLELATGRGEEAIKSTEAMIAAEDDPDQRAELHVRAAEMILRVRDDETATLEHLQAALKAAPKNARALAAAERFYQELDDPRGLASVYTAQLGRLDRDDREGRARVLDRLAKVRRYDLRDLEGALEALEAIAALDPQAVKPREDAARVLTELHRDEDAAAAWRSVLERDPLSSDAWRALFATLCRAGQGDEAFAVAQTLVSVELGDRELERAVRQLRPPFPRWPRATDDPSRVKRELSHPLERTPVRTVFDVVGRPVHAAFAKPIAEFGFRKKDRLSERSVPPSLLLAVRTVSELIGLGGVPPLFRAERTAPGQPAFALIPAREPGIAIAEEALKGGMTPERAFALGRAMACLMPHALPVSTLSAQRVKEILEALTARFVPAAEGNAPHSRIHELGQRLDVAIFRGQPPKTAERLRAALETALRDYNHAAAHLHISDWTAGVGYTGDRLGFLLVGDLAPCVRVIKAGAPKDRMVGARLATRELVLFSASASYLKLRHELGLALPPNIAAPILELGG